VIQNPDVCIYYGINNVDLIGTDTHIVIHAYISSHDTAHSDRLKLHANMSMFHNELQIFDVFMNIIMRIICSV